MMRIRAIAPGLITLASFAVLGIVLASQYFGGLEPCKLCHYQRWPYIFTFTAGLLAWALPSGSTARRWLITACAMAFAIGGAVAIYHAGVEYGWFTGPTSCSGTGETPDTIEKLRRQLLSQPMVRCDEPAWTKFGVSMAGYNVLTSAVLAAVSLFATTRMQGNPNT